MLLVRKHALSRCELVSTSSHPDPVNLPPQLRQLGQPAQQPPTRQPLLWAALTFSAGIIAGAHVWRPPSWWTFAIVAFLASGTYLARRRIWMAKTIALGTLFLLGALNVQVRRPVAPASPEVPFADGREVMVTAHIIAEGSIRSAGSGGVRQTIDVETEEIISDDAKVHISSGVRLGIYASLPKGDESARLSPEMPIFHYGERLKFPTKLRPPRNFRNPGAFDYQGYLADHGISALGSAKLESVELLPGFCGNRMELWRTRIHRSVIEKVHALWSPADAVLMDAMVIGEEAFIDRDERVNFQRSGTYHILVVSGMNVSILAAVIFGVLRRLRVSEVASTILTIVLSAAYALLTNVGSPVWRAVLMMSLYLLTRLLYRQRSMLNAIGAAALGLLIVDPRVLLGASFQMTFLSVFIIAAIGAPLLERTSQRYHRGLLYLDSITYDSRVPAKVAQFRLDLRMVAERLDRFLGKGIVLPVMGKCTRVLLRSYEILFISFLMQLGLSLPMAYYFHRATVVGVPANAGVVPLTGILMPTAVLAVALGYVLPALANIPAGLAALALKGITGTVHSLGYMRIADLRVPLPDPAVALCAAMALALAMILARKRFALAAIGVAALITAALWLSLAQPTPKVHPGTLEMTAIDVGQGDSILLATPQGKLLLVDAGGPVGEQHTQLDFGEDVVSPYLWSRGISHLDAIAITHGHSDHIGGMRAVINNFRPQELWIGTVPPSEALSLVLRDAQHQGTAIVHYFQGDSFDFGGTQVRVLAPTRGYITSTQPRNNDSLVLHVTYQDSSILLEGDAEKRIEEQIAAQQPQADLLKVAHHGAITSSTPELLQAVKPRMAVISVGDRNTFGHPRIEVLQRLQDLGVPTYRTDLDGAVTFYLDGHTIIPELALRYHRTLRSPRDRRPAGILQ